MKNQMYTTHAVAYDKAAQDNIYNALLERPSLLSLVDIKPGDKVLDLGCGSGIYTELFMGMGAQVTCVDLHQEMLDILQQKMGDTVTTYQQDLAGGLPKETNESYDWVIAPLMVHYIDDLKPLFTDVQRVLKTDGKFVFSTHHPVTDFEFSETKNYYQKEHLTDEWGTIETNVEVSFYRRPLQEFFQSLHQAGLAVSNMNEGMIDPKVAEFDKERYERLSTTPNFIFFQCIKR